MRMSSTNNTIWMYSNTKFTDHPGKNVFTYINNNNNNSIYLNTIKNSAKADVVVYGQ